jgi:hypothetical protein
MDVRDWAAGAEIVRTALRALLAKRGSGEKVSALIDRKHSAFLSIQERLRMRHSPVQRKKPFK